MSSTRLPAKAMLSLGGRPLIVLTAQRAANRGHEVLIATSDEPDDDVIANCCREYGIDVFRGPLNDTLARFAAASADMKGEDIIVRLTGDNALPDGALIDAAVAGLDAPDGSKRRYAHIGGYDASVPYGIAAEAFDVAALHYAEVTATEPEDREHVTPFLRSNFGDHVIPVAEPDPAWPGLRCTIDTFDDYIKLARLFDAVDDPVNTPWRTACDYLKLIAPPTYRMAPRRQNSLGQGPLVLGTAQLGSPYGLRSEDALMPSSVAHDVLSTAAAAGVTHVDTARAYGHAEARVGTSLRRGLSERMAVVTKILPMPEHSGPEFVEASLERSLRLLQTESVAAVLLHRARDWGRPGVREMLASFMQDGRASAVGVSVQSPEELTAVLSDPLCQYVQIPFNIIDRRWVASHVDGQLTRRSDVIVSVRSVFLRGLLVTDQLDSWPINSGLEPAQVIGRLDFLAKELRRSSRADLCVGYVLAHEWITSVVLGAETPGQVAENARLVVRPPLSSSEISQIHELVPGGNETICDPSRWLFK